MGRQLRLENKSKDEIKNFLYSHIYSKYKGKIRANHYTEIGSVLLNDIEKIIGKYFNFDDMKNAILELIPSTYNEIDCIKIFDIINSRLKK